MKPSPHGSARRRPRAAAPPTSAASEPGRAGRAPAISANAAPGGGPRAPAPPLWRDRWAWACALAVIPVVLHSLGAPLGEPVAEDFDFLHYALFSRFTLLDGGGSQAFWRPLPHQVYYRTLWPVLLGHPALVAVLHTVLLALATVLLYRAFRRGWPPAWAAAIATFPLLSESTRALVSWPSHFVDLGVWVFTALVLHETAARRLWSALAALLASLLCKEIALVAALFAPWMPGIGPRDRRARMQWAAAMGALAIAWGVTYWVVRQRAGLHLPHNLETSTATVGTPFLVRLAWAAGNSLRACFSLPAAGTSRDGPLGVAVTLLVAGALVTVIASARRRRALSQSSALAMWGLGWFLAASATMAPVFPLWAPNRSLYGSLGLGALAAPLLGAAHPWALGSMVALRLAAFALSPPPPADIASAAPRTGAFLDFERLVRLQRLMRETRRALGAAHPTLPARAHVGLYNLPFDAQYSYGGSLSLQAWYRDTTLRWVRHSDMIAHPDTPMVTIVEFEAGHRPQFALVPPRAMRALMRGISATMRKDWAGALAELDSADAQTEDPNAVTFTAQVAGNRAVAWSVVGRVDEAEREARRGIALWPENTYAHYALAVVAYRRGALAEVAAQADSVLLFMPNHYGAKQLLDLIARDSSEAARRPGMAPSANPGR